MFWTWEKEKLSFTSFSNSRGRIHPPFIFRETWCCLEEAQRILLLNQDPCRKKNYPLHNNMACNTKAVVLIQQGRAPSIQGLPPADLITVQQGNPLQTVQPEGGLLRSVQSTGTDGSAAFHLVEDLLEKSENGYMPTSFPLPIFLKSTICYYKNNP